MDDSDRQRLERIERILQELVEVVRRKPRRIRKRGPNPPTRKVSADIERLVDTRLSRAGYYRV
jgi:hypothetical protein